MNTTTTTTRVPEPVPAKLDRLLFGDNQFFGINHRSEEKAREQAMRFQNVDAIMDVIDDAYASGIRTLMCTTHDRISEVAERVRAQPERYDGFAFFPCMPYAHKYADAVTESGILGALGRFMPDEGALNAMMRGGRSLAKKDIEGIITLLVDAEMAGFTGVRSPVIWLQNVVVDLLLGLGFSDAFAIFANHVRSKYSAQPGFITMNLPMLLDHLDRAGIENPLVCSNINKIGFRMSGGVEAYQDALEKRPFRAVAMSVFASGAIPPREAIEWIFAQPGIESLVFGASSRNHIESTVGLVREFER
ncbi:hypothetical protein A20C1_09284 [marine actinobacterium PHSC20C1]|nr:hypothetical protein A20C1_09284 [marine actinobacterium PHSC20C1]